MKIPLLQDHHNHTSIYSACRININHITLFNDAIKILKELPQKISVVLGWNSHLYDLPQSEIDKLPPLIISRTSLHGFLVNAAAQEILKKDYACFLENRNNLEWIESHIPQICQFYGAVQSLQPDDVAYFFEKLEKLGVYYAEDMLLASEQALKIILNSPYAHRTKFWTDLEGYYKLSLEAQQNIYGIKVFTDGALSTGTAAIHDEYPLGGKGVLAYSDNDLEELLRKISTMEKPVAIHAIGDRAIDQVVVTIEKLQQQKIIFSQVRIEHAQLISLETAFKAKEMGIILSMQPNFSSDSRDYQNQISLKNCQNNNPFRQLIDEVGFVPGKDLLFGSDGMPHGAQFALEQALFPPCPSQKLTVDEFVAGYCLPDFTNGYLEIQIDEKNKRVIIEKIIIDKNSCVSTFQLCSDYK